MKDLDESSTKELEKILQSIDTDGSGTIDFTGNFLFKFKCIIIIV